MKDLKSDIRAVLVPSHQCMFLAAVGVAIRRQRLKINLTERELARTLRLSRDEVEQLECGHLRLTVNNFLDIAGALRTQATELMYEVWIAYLQSTRIQMKSRATGETDSAEAVTPPPSLKSYVFLDEWAAAILESARIAYR